MLTSPSLKRRTFAGERGTPSRAAISSARGLFADPDTSFISRWCGVSLSTTRAILNRSRHASSRSDLKTSPRSRASKSGALACGVWRRPENLSYFFTIFSKPCVFSQTNACSCPIWACKLMALRRWSDVAGVPSASPDALRGLRASSAASAASNSPIFCR